MKNILGLDLGTNSIGWSLIQQDFETKTGNILGMGSRIIPMDQGILGEFDKGNSISQTAERTSFRGTRRLRERNLLRRERLHRVLNILGFLPPHFAQQIDFDQHFGQFKPNKEPKLSHDGNGNFIFLKSFEEMLADFVKHQPDLVSNNKKVPHDWTIYYLRKKALTQKIEKEELAWLLLHFNQKRGYYQLRGEDSEDIGKLVEFHSLKVIKVENTGEQNVKKQTLYKIVLENNWEFIKPSNMPVEWTDKIKDFIVTTDIDENGKIKIDNFGKEKRSFRAPEEDDWTLLKKKTEFDIDKSNKTVGCYIYETMLQNPNQKIKGKLVRTIERKFYKKELQTILERQINEHPELKNTDLYKACIEELYENNESHRNTIQNKGFAHLFLNDIIFYQRPLKSKKSLISDCRYEFRSFVKNDKKELQPLKCIAKSHPLFQEFRLWQFIQNLKIYQKEKVVDGKLQTDVNVTADFLATEDDWIKLFDWLNDKKEIEQKPLLKHLLKPLKLKEENYRWNYVEDKIYPCNETRWQIITGLSKVEGVAEDFLTTQIIEDLWHILYSIEDKIEIEKALKSFGDRHSLDDGFVDVFKKVKPYKKDYGSYSAKATKKLLALMRFGHYWKEDKIDNKTKERINKILDGEYDEKIKNRVREKTISLNSINSFKGLPLWLACYVVYDRHSEEGDILKWKTPQDIQYFLKNTFKQHSLRNPIVEQVIAETLRVVADIWKQYGNGAENFFDEIHIELGREMKNPADKRKQMTNQITNNENTNLRIKLLLTALLNDQSVENVRPYSPSQQEILKLYEEGVLNSEELIPEDILKISKLAQPSRSELTKYKLWLEQKYRSPYTGDMIPLNKLFTPAYEIEHIIPQSRYFDDSLSNKVICEAEVNKDKDNSTAYEYIKNNKGKKVELSFGRTATIFTEDAYEDFIKTNYSKSRSKSQKLLMDDIPESFINRQLNDSRYISKVVKNLLSNIVREENEQETTSKHVTASNGNITSILKQNWGLNDIWNDIITPRFERLNLLTNSNNFGSWTNKEGKQVFQTQIPLELSKGFNKKRIDHRHHALDALVIACATKNHINYLNNEFAKSEKRHDLKAVLCFKNKTDDKGNYKWVFHKPWESFTKDSKEALNVTIVSFKQNLRVINKTVNYYQSWQKDEKGNLIKLFVKQAKGDSWAIRKPMHKDTISGIVQLRGTKIVRLTDALTNWEMIVDKLLKHHIKELIVLKYDEKALIKYFKDKKNIWNNKDISKVEVYYFEADNVATRVTLDESFDSSAIMNITDTGIQKILLKHLEKRNETIDNKIVEHPELAFSPDGIDDLNKNITELNGGNFHQPIFKVRYFEPKGNKFNIGNTGNKKNKFAEAAKGTNLFFAVYQDSEGKRNYESIPLNIVIERQKQGLSSVPETNEKKDSLLFYLSPNDLVYIPTSEERENSNAMDFGNMTKDQISRIYKIVSFTGNRLYAIPNSIASPIIDKVEFTLLNKLEFSLEKNSIKEFCWKLETNRIGNVKKAIK